MTTSWDSFVSNKKILVTDPQLAGIAGDMFVAALLDLGADVTRVIEVMEASINYIPNCQKISVKPKSVTRSHISGLYLEITIEESYTTRPGKVLIDAVQSMTKDLKLSKPASAYANRAIHTLVEAEATVHKHSIEKVHLHAAGSVDTVLDIIGAATALDTLNISDSQVTEY